MLRRIALCCALLVAGSSAASVPLRGRVVDEQSRPIAAARIGLFAAFALDADRSGIVTSAEDGSFTFSAHPRQKHLLWVEADGFAPRLLDGVAANAPALLDTIRLVRGASLSISIADPRAGVRLQLFPRRVELGDHVTEDLARALWTRNVTARVEWPSLPPGEYELWLRGDVPRPLLTITLGRGDRKTHELSLASQAPRDATITFEGGAVPHAVVTRWIGDRREEIPLSARRIDGATMTIAGGCVDGGSYLMSSADRFAVVPRFDATCTARAAVLRRADAKVRLRWSRGSAPSSGVLEARGCDSEATTIAVPFTIGADGVADLTMPAGCSATTIAVPGFAPVDLAAVRGRSDYGTHDLREGASLLVRVMSREDAMPLSGATVFAFTAHDLNAARLEDIVPDRATARAVTNRDGWARLTLPAGDVVVGVVRGAARLPWLSETYGVEVGRETIADLEVPRPGALNLRVTLAPELVEAGVRVAQVYLQPATGQRWPPRAIFAAQLRDGLARFDEVPPGKWLAATMIRMLDDPPMRGDSMGVEVHDGVGTDATLHIKGLIFRGRIIDGSGGKIGRSVLLTPDERGAKVTTAVGNDQRFVAMLEKSGVYSAMLLVDEQETVVPGVRFDDPDEDVEIRLPNGSLAGRVIDEEERPVAGARIAATALHPSEGAPPVQLDMTSISGADGSFRFPRVTRGRWMLSAKTKSAESERVPVEIGDGESVGNVLLRLDDLTKGSVRVVYDSGRPAAGAKVTISAPPAGVGDYGPSHLVVTDATGRCSFPASSVFREQTLRFSITASDGTVASFRRRLTDDLTLVLPSVTGQLMVTMIAGEWPPVPAHTWLVAEDGSIVGSRAGRVLAGDNGRPTRFVVPRIAPGVWRLVAPSTPLEIHQVLSGNAAGVRTLGLARVTPGGSAEMRVDAKREGDE